MMTHLLASALLALPVTFVSMVEDGPEPIDVISALEQAVSDAIEHARPAVVTIDRVKSDDGETLAIRGRNAMRAPNNPNGVVFIDGFGMRNDGPASADYVSYDFGSGVIVGDEGQILTTYHVVAGAANLFVRVQGLEPFEAEIIAADPRSDLAVIAPVGGLAPFAEGAFPDPIPIGDASLLRPGSFLVALGNSHNVSRDGQASASFGILANSARRLIAPSNDFGQVVPTMLQHYSTLFQLDSKLNLGMSGGAVVNLKGELMAITTASANAVGYDPRAGYAIPMDSLGRHALDALIEGKEVEYGFLGISLSSPSNIIREVQPGTPAGEGGLLQGDSIEEVAGQPVTDFDGLVRSVNPLPVGEPVELTIRRDGRVLTKEVVLSKFPIEGEIIATTKSEAWRGIRIDFPSVISPRDELLTAMARGGVGVVEVVSGTPSEEAGLRVGQIITQVDGKAVRTPRAFREVVKDLDGKAVRLSTDRGPIMIEPDAGSEID
ncbi:PDZ domain-containing protein [Tautonia marina]|uniref:PDZ domain-containing protein n=1 Tax=Tautonia marina TaxID=2653855 RepID=UPI001260BEB6|nr:PDZ domain-containing protein [Tautonia marina]